MKSRGLVVFDLDGTLLRGPTVCELLAAPLGRTNEMRAFESVRTEQEIARARVEMARWYSGIPRGRLLKSLETARCGSGVVEGVALLREAGIEVAIASITWKFGVEFFAARLGVSRTLGTGLREDGTIDHAWPWHKAAWVRALSSELAVPHERTAAVGDSSRDIDMLRATALRVFVGLHPPDGLKCVHFPDGDIAEVARHILAQWAAV
jgi:phosphoserine phosphatase